MQYKVPFVNYPDHYRSMEKELDIAIKEVLSRGDLILREQLSEFEEKMAAFIGRKHAIGVSSGTDALILSLKAAGIGAGDEVITVAHTFVATLASIIHCGATPVLVDVADDYNMNVNLLESAITPKTRAVIPVHLNGRVCDMPRIMAICKKHNLIVIEDSAQALGAKIDGKRSGTFGLSACFSFYPAKMLGSAGDGGLVATDSDDIATRVRLLRSHGVDRVTGDIWCYGFTNRLDNLQAAILNVKIRYLNTWIERRRELAALYEQGLSSLSRVKAPPPPEPDNRYFDVYQNYVIRTTERDKLVNHLRERGVETLISWPIPNHKHPALGLNHFNLPETEAISKEVVSLPMYPELSNEQAEIVIEAVSSFYAKSFIPTVP
jgi:dTDP-4-amino-4,6-dideoxygalactose transaminase